MRFSVKSGGYLAELKKRASRSSVKSFGARITVPEDMKWWVYQEFGTATRRDQDPSSENYTIEPIYKQFLEFRGSSGDVVVVHEVAPHATFNNEGEVHGTTGGHPGVYPQHMVGGILDEIGQEAIASVCEALIASGFNLEEAKAALLDQSMPKVKELIRQRFDELLSHHEQALHPKLDGASAAEVFDQEAVITETEV